MGLNGIIPIEGFRTFNFNIYSFSMSFVEQRFDSYVSKAQ